ncbi:DUF2653 family protein [Saccharibacillus alkalitolerans]|uniref:DUF2653 family protein n=1 Tax=Saccharibacillus alkalitolerans TaxID=2705290 RepID=A0ABX0F238_9BACL|nr:DUF2653 family protein [Saccharibacillus alkalitolerans]NGZ74458.1 DUF2653 family protein [Saccharibacillus alkalitolerans]
MQLTMDEIINAVCISIAERRQIRPTEVTVEMLWDEDLGYSAQITVQGRSWYINQGALIEAIIRYLDVEYRMRVFADQVTLDLTDEIIAHVAQ